MCHLARYQNFFDMDLLHWRHRAAMLGVKAIALYALVQLAHFWQLLLRVNPIDPQAAAHFCFFDGVTCTRSIAECYLWLVKCLNIVTQGAYCIKLLPEKNSGYFKATRSWQAPLRHANKRSMLIPVTRSTQCVAECAKCGFSGQANTTLVHPRSSVFHRPMAVRITLRATSSQDSSRNIHATGLLHTEIVWHTSQSPHR